jgi:hypothetical protein
VTDDRRTPFRPEGRPAIDPDGAGGGLEDASPADRALVEALRARASRPAAPPALRAAVEAALAAEVARVRAGGGAAGAAAPRVPWVPALAAGLAALLLAGASAAFWLGLPAAGRRVAGDVARAAGAEYARLEATGPAEPARDPASLAARLTAALGVPVRLAWPRDPRLAPRGTAPSRLLGADGVAVFFEADGAVVTLSLVPSPRGLAAENRVRLGRGRPVVTSAGTHRFVLWRQGPLMCALAGDLPERRLTAIFRAVRPGLEVGS